MSDPAARRGGPPRRTKRELAATAYHEAGHAFAVWKFGYKIESATIKPRGRALGCVRLKRWGHPLKCVRSMIITLLAGGEAEARYGPRRRIVKTGALFDLCEAHGLTCFLDNGDGEFRSLLQQTRDLINDPKNWALIEMLAKVLLEKRTLTSKEIEAVSLAVDPLRFCSRQTFLCSSVARAVLRLIMPPSR